MSMKMHERREDIDYDAAIKRRGTPLRKVHYAIAVFYALALLFNAQGLHQNAELMRYGKLRSFCLRLIKPIAESPAVSWMSEPREKLEDIIY